MMRPLEDMTIRELRELRGSLLAKIDLGNRASEHLEKLGILHEWSKEAALIVQQSRRDDGVSENTILRIPRKRNLSTSAERALMKAGQPLHMRELIIAMEEEGWVRTGEYQADMKNVFASLSVKSGFVNLGRNVWDLVKSKK